MQVGSSVPRQSAGVNSVTVNLANERAHVDTAAHIDPQTLIDAVNRAGYSATLSQIVTQKPIRKPVTCTTNAGPCCWPSYWRCR